MGFLQGDVRRWQDIDMLFRKNFDWQQGLIMDRGCGEPDYGFNGSRTRGFLTLAAGLGVLLHWQQG